MTICMFRRPFGQSLKRQRASGERRFKRQTFLPNTFFRKYSGKVLTTENRNVFLEIFPLRGAGSLKFTLCD